MIVVNKNIDSLTLQAYNEDLKIFNSVESLRKMLINLKIISANLEGTKKDEIKVFATMLEDNIKKIQDGTFKVKEIIKEIAKENKA